MKRLLFALLLLLTINVCACGKKKVDPSALPDNNNTPTMEADLSATPIISAIPSEAPADTPASTVEPTLEPTVEPTVEPTIEPNLTPEPTCWPGSNAGFFTYVKKREKVTITGVKTGAVIKEKEKIIDSETGEEKEVEIELTFPEALYIPSCIDGLPVTAIADKAFYNCKEIKEVYMPDTIVNMGSWTFYGCSNLTKVQLSESLDTIGYSSFAGCNLLKDIEILPNIEVIASYAFCECDALTFLDLSHVKQIGGAAFKNCSSLKYVTLGDDMTEINEYTFESCSSLLGVYLPDGITTIKYKAFNNCRALYEIYLYTVTNIEAYAFNGCHGLKEIVFSDELSDINEYTFNECLSLSDVTFGAGLLNIAQNSFTMTNISSVVIPETCENVDDNAFDEGVTGIPEKKNEE